VSMSGVAVEASVHLSFPPPPLSAHPGQTWGKTLFLAGRGPQVSAWEWRKRTRLASKKRNELLRRQSFAFSSIRVVGGGINLSIHPPLKPTVRKRVFLGFFLQSGLGGCVETVDGGY